MLPFSPCIRQWNANVPVVVMGTDASCALNAGMSPDSYVPFSKVAECTVESLFLKFTYCPALTDSGFGEYTLFVMKTVIGLPLVPSPLPGGGLPLDGAVSELELQETAARAELIRMPTAIP
jgi:hypothetical protein